LNGPKLVDRIEEPYPHLEKIIMNSWIDDVLVLHIGGFSLIKRDCYDG